MERKSIKERFKEFLAKDPYIATFLTDIRFMGLDVATENGTKILMYSNKKTGITILIDPAKPTIVVRDEKTNEHLNIHIQLATQTILETYGMPTISEIPKFGFGLFSLENVLENALRNFPSTHPKRHPTTTEDPENRKQKAQEQEEPLPKTQEHSV